MYVMNHPDEFYNEFELPQKRFFGQMACVLWKGDPFCDQSEIVNEPLIFPNEMSLELAAKVPPTIVYSTEFDFFRKMAEEACYLYQEAGTLLDCGI
jgi:hypothetical protein